MEDEEEKYQLVLRGWILHHLVSMMHPFWVFRPRNHLLAPPSQYGKDRSNPSLA
jgi:hypothetical protein